MPQLFSEVILSESITFSYLLNKFWTDVGDSRVSNHILLRYGPLLSIFSSTIYLLMCLLLSPTRPLMKNRLPNKELNTIWLLYNILMFTMNVKFLQQIVVHLNFGHKLLQSTAPDRSDISEETIRLINLYLFYYFLKFADLFETIFLLSMKKSLNIYQVCHHCLVPILGFILLRLYASCEPMGIFFILNSFIHSLTHFYYIISITKPDNSLYSLKKMISNLEIGQFFIYTTYLLYVINTNPGYPNYVLMFAAFLCTLFPLLSIIWRQQKYSNNDYNNNKKFDENIHIDNDLSISFYNSFF